MIKKIIGFYLAWRVGLIIIAFLSALIFPFFKGRFPYVEMLQATGLPRFIWGFGNFDGVHYLRIAISGYTSEYTQAFFPFFPLMVSILGFLHSPFLVALLISNTFFLGGLLVLYKLFRIDFDHKVAITAIIFLLSFPTSFYFGSVYTEGIFLFLAATSLFFIRKGNFLLGGLFGAFASGTKVVGILFFPVILIEVWLRIKSKDLKPWTENFYKGVFSAFVSLGGVICYMLYLYLSKNDALFFLTAQPFFGSERSSHPFILLPQVFFRYFKMLIDVPINSLTFFNVFLELLFTIGALLLVLWSYKKMRFSYFIFSLGCLIIPTLTGTLTSMPRYVLMSFLVLPVFVQKIPKQFVLVFITGMILITVVLTSLFIGGYWIA